MAVKGKRDGQISHVLFKFGVALAFSLGGIVFTFLRSKRIMLPKPKSSLPSPGKGSQADSDVGNHSLKSLSLASANPVQAQELDKCGTATNLNAARPSTSTAAPRPHSASEPANPLTASPPVDVFKYNLAIQKMKELPEDDPRSFMQQAYVYCAYCNGAYDQPGQGTLDIQVHNHRSRRRGGDGSSTLHGRGNEWASWIREGEGSGGKKEGRRRWWWCNEGKEKQWIVVWDEFLRR